MSEKWTQKWPTKEGHYWFYSYRYGRGFNSDIEPQLMLMVVRKASNGFVYIANGQFVYHSEPEYAWFMKAELPELPKDFETGRNKALEDD